MRKNRQSILLNTGIIILGLIFMAPLFVKAQSQATWYRNAQERIDTLRKGSFGIQVVDKNGQPFEGAVSVRMAKHEYPFGISFDFYESAVSMGSSYNTSSAIQAEVDAEIYKTERYGKTLAYAIPVQRGKQYKLTLKFAEIYFGTAGSRLFDVHVEGKLFLDNFDTYAKAGGKNIAVDTSLVLTAADDFLNFELTASLDNAAIKGFSFFEVGTNDTTRVNCGGGAITTLQGNTYQLEESYFDADVNTIASKEQWMKAAMLKYFNSGVTGNTFKWSGIQPQNTAPNYTNFENALRWTQKVGWDLRGHTLLWGGADDHSTPGWVRRLPTPQAITDTCKMRVVREVTRYRGQIKDYDVINEPLWGHADSLRKHVGDSIIWNCFKWAREADPDAELYVNDYNVEYNWGQAKEYRDLVIKMKQMGAPVTGVGMQAHFWDCCRPNVDELVNNVNIVAQAGLPIKFTEFDYGGNLTQAEQAADFIKVLTIAFSHPSIVGMMSWGLSDEGAWRENTGYFDANYKPKLAADTLLYYTKTKWATNFDSQLNSSQPLEFKAYYGTYNIEVAFGDTVKVFSVNCSKANADSVFVLHEQDATLKGPQLLKVELDDQKTVRLVFDKPILTNSLRRSDFKFFNKANIGIQSAQVEVGNPNAVLLSLTGSAAKGTYLSVAYYPGSLLAADNSKSGAFGPETIANPLKTVGVEYLSENTIKVYPNPATTFINVEAETAPFTVTLFNSLGMQVLSHASDDKSLQIDVSSLMRGMYVLRISNSNQSINTRKILIREF